MKHLNIVINELKPYGESVDGDIFFFFEKYEVEEAILNERLIFPELRSIHRLL